MTTATNPLIGKVLTAVYLADDGGAIRFDVSDGDPIVARADGDCCSHTWIEDVIGADALIGVPVNSVRDVDLPEELQIKTKTGHYEEEMSYYGCVIETAKGRCVLAYRNSSNGYYGGSLSWSGDDYFYGGVFGQNVSNGQWKQIAPLAERPEQPPSTNAVDPVGGRGQEVAPRDANASSSPVGAEDGEIPKSRIRP